MKSVVALHVKNVICCCGKQQEQRVASGMLLVKQMPPSSLCLGTWLTVQNDDYFPIKSGSASSGAERALATRAGTHTPAAAPCS